MRTHGVGDSFKDGFLKQFSKYLSLRYIKHPRGVNRKKENERDKFPQSML